MAQHDCNFQSTHPTKQWNDCFACLYTVPDWSIRKATCKPLGLLHRASATDNPCKPSLELYMYVAYGHYAAQLAWWLNFFPPERFLLLNSEDLR